MIPTIELWEASIAIRDNTFLQLAGLVVVGYLGYRLLSGIIRTVVLYALLTVFAVVLVLSVVNILWPI